MAEFHTFLQPDYPWGREFEEGAAAEWFPGFVIHHANASEGEPCVIDFKIIEQIYNRCINYINSIISNLEDMLISLIPLKLEINIVALKNITEEMGLKWGAYDTKRQKLAKVYDEYKDAKAMFDGYKKALATKIRNGTEV